MIQARYATGRILAGLGAVLVVAVLVLTMVSFAHVDNCSEPDCDYIALQETFERAVILLPVSVLIGAAGVALVHDTYRKTTALRAAIRLGCSHVRRERSARTDRPQRGRVPA